MSDSDIYQILYRSFDCLVQQIVMPAIRGRSQRKLRSFQRPGCNSGNLADFGTTQTEGWRALAERYWCILEEQLYPAVISSRLSQQRGMYINSSRALKANLRSLRQCPKGLVVCAVVKNEAAYIQEWLTFHLHSGVEHFYLYFNEDEEDTLAVVQPFVDAGIVTTENIEGEGVQGLVYNKCLGNVKVNRPSAKWISFQDVDEYLFRVNQECMMELLESLHDHAALAVNWRLYSYSNHVLQLPRELLLMETNVHTLGVDRHVKSVVHVDHTLSCNHPHFCLYESGQHAKDEVGRPVEGPFNDDIPSPQQLRMHHYHKRTLQDFLMKRFRGRADLQVTEFDLSALANQVRQDFMNSHVDEDVESIKFMFDPVRALLGLPMTKDK
ncbi:hypothetical protein VYU27_008385 [Nannochloropsis oceanica]